MKFFKTIRIPPPKNDLYYTLLDWCDQHPEIRQEFLKNTETYTVEYTKEDDWSEKIFTPKDYSNPYLAARRFISQELKLNPNLRFELWLNPNPHRDALNCLGRVVWSNLFDNEEK